MYRKIRGKRRDSWLLWALEEKHLYVKHRVNGSQNEDWICYQNILCKTNKNAVKCTSAVQIGSNKICRPKNGQNPHTKHANHQLIHDDLVSLNNIKDDCIAAKKSSSGLSTDISASDIFTREIAK